MRKDADPKFDSEKMTNEYPEDEVTSFGCQIKLCRRSAQAAPSVPGTTVRPATACQVYRWSSWGSWSSCDKRCSKDGLRTRSRSCEETCSGGRTEKLKKCRGQHSSLYNLTLTDKDWTKCSPCPSLERPTWSEWADWRITESAREYCGPGGLTKQAGSSTLIGRGPSRLCYDWLDLSYDIKTQ